MSEGASVRPRPRYAGVLLALLAALILVLAWIYFLPLLDGTAMEELEYVIYTVLAVGILSGFHWLEVKIFSSSG
jgi:hypothetical protein